MKGGEYGTADAAQVLAGYTVGRENGIVVGTMPNKGASTIQASLVSNIPIPAGYYDGFGLVLLPQATPGNVKIWSLDNAGSTIPGFNSYVRAHITMPAVLKTGTYRVGFGMSGTTINTAYGKIYVNGLPRGINRSAIEYLTFVEDVYLNAGDVVEFWTYCSPVDYNYAYLRNMWLGILTPQYI